MSRLTRKESWIVSSYRSLTEEQRGGIDSCLLAFGASTPPAIRADIEAGMRALKAEWAKEAAKEAQSGKRYFLVERESETANVRKVTARDAR